MTLHKRYSAYATSKEVKQTFSYRNISRSFKEPPLLFNSVRNNRETAEASQEGRKNALSPHHWLPSPQGREHVQAGRGSRRPRAHIPEAGVTASARGGLATWPRQDSAERASPVRASPAPPCSDPRGGGKVPFPRGTAGRGRPRRVGRATAARTPDLHSTQDPDADPGGAAG